WPGLSFRARKSRGRRLRQPQPRAVYRGSGRVDALRRRRRAAEAAMLTLQTFPTQRKQPSTISRLYVLLYLARTRQWLAVVFMVSAIIFVISLARKITETADDDVSCPILPVSCHT